MALKACIALLLVAAAPAGGSENIQLAVSPALSTQPAIINVRVSIEPDGENRAVQIVAESSDYYRSSRVELDGTNASRISTFMYRDLPAGSYEIRGTLIGRDGKERGEIMRNVVVMP